MSLRVKAARSLAWTALESGGLSVLSFVVLAVVARNVTPSDLGIVTVALGLVQILTLPVEVLFHDALVQRSDTSDEHYDTAFTVSVVIAFLLCGSCWSFSGVISAFLNSKSAGLILAISSFSLIASACGSSLVARQRRELGFQALALRSLVGRLAGALVGISAAIEGAGLWSLVAQQVVMTSCASLCLWLFAADRPRLVFRSERLRDMAAFSIASLVNTALFVTEPRLFTLLVAAALGPTSAGYLNLAFRVVDMPRDVIGGAASQLALPLFQRLAGDRPALGRAYTEAVTFTCALGFPLFFGLAACAPEVIELIFGQKWLPAAPYVGFFACLTIAYFPKLYSASLLSALGKPKLFTPVLLVAIATIVIGMLTIGRQALWIAAAVWALRLVTSMPVEIIATRAASGMSMRDQFRGAGSAFWAAAIMALVVWGGSHAFYSHLTPALRLACNVAVGAIVYVVLFAVLDRSVIGRLIGFGRMMVSRQSAATPTEVMQPIPVDEVG